MYFTCLLCVLHGNESSSGRDLSIFPGTYHCACTQQVSNKCFCRLDGHESGRSLGFLRRLVQERGLEGNPATSHFHLSVLTSEWNWTQWGSLGAEVPQAAFGKGWGSWVPACGPPGLGRTPDLETEHTHLGEPPFRHQLPEEPEEWALLGLEALGEGGGGRDGRELTPLPRPSP